MPSTSPLLPRPSCPLKAAAPSVTPSCDISVGLSFCPLPSSRLCPLGMTAPLLTWHLQWPLCLPFADKLLKSSPHVVPPLPVSQSHESLPSTVTCAHQGHQNEWCSQGSPDTSTPGSLWMRPRLDPSAQTFLAHQTWHIHLPVHLRPAYFQRALPPGVLPRRISSCPEARLPVQWLSRPCLLLLTTALCINSTSRTRDAQG